MNARTVSSTIERRVIPAGPWPVMGCGVGLRAEHYNYILSEKPKVDWFEAVTENFMDSGGRPLDILTKIRQSYPVALHGVSLSIGSADPLDQRYLERLKILADRVDPFIVSDHLCWSGVEGENLHDLLPLPLTDEAADYVAERIQKVQDYLGRRFLIENVSTYVTYKHSTMPEWQFLTEVARRAGCGILLDLNNIYVNSKNHGFNPEVYVRNIPAELVAQFHLAGHTDMGAFLFDTHSAEIVHPVWQLYERALALYGQVSTLIEWDAAIPEFSKLLAEAQKARAYYDKFDQGRYPKAVPVFSPKKYENKFPQEKWKMLLEDQRRMKTMVRPGSHEAPGASGILNPQGGVSGQERMSVYAGGYLARIHESLTETFESVKHVLGETAFLQLAEQYAEAQPSHSYNLSDAGKKLPEYFKETIWIQKLPFLSDLALMERLIAESFHAFPEKPFDPSILAGLDEDGLSALRLRFQPFTKIVASDWPILDIWNARKKPAKEMNIDLMGRPQNILIYRQGAEVRCREISQHEFQMVSSLMAGESLEEACDDLAKLTDDELPVMEWFAFWSSQRLLSGGK